MTKFCILSHPEGVVSGKLVDLVGAISAAVRETLTHQTKEMYIKVLSPTHAVVSDVHGHVYYTAGLRSVLAGNPGRPAATPRIAVESDYYKWPGTKPADGWYSAANICELAIDNAEDVLKELSVGDFAMVYIRRGGLVTGSMAFKGFLQEWKKECEKTGLSLSREKFAKRLASQHIDAVKAWPEKTVAAFLVRKATPTKLVALYKRSTEFVYKPKEEAEQ
jgi:hypothetical protein